MTLTRGVPLAGLWLCDVLLTVPSDGQLAQNGQSFPIGWSKVLSGIGSAARAAAVASDVPPGHSSLHCRGVSMPAPLCRARRDKPRLPVQEAIIDLHSLMPETDCCKCPPGSLGTFTTPASCACFHLGCAPLLGLLSSMA
jgi:hypothetical protein